MRHYRNSKVNFLNSLIDDARGYGSLVFRKQDGSIRRLTFQTGNDAAYCVGSERGKRASKTFAAHNPHMRRLRDVHVAKRDGMAKAWRTVDLTKVESCRVNGETVRFF